MLKTFQFRCILAALLAATLLSSTAQAADRLNFLFITLDDMNRDSVGAYGAKVPETTPSIDRLAAEGLRFEQGHVTIAICQPTRAVWMTGRYPHNNGALGFNPIKRGIPTLPETLKENGYLTGILGKTEHVVPSRKQAFDYHRDRGEMNNGRSADLYAQFTEEFLQQAKDAQKPFFLMVNTHDPHRPFDNRRPADKRGGGYPAPSRIYQPEEILVPGFLPDLPEIREEIAQYYSSVRRADDVVGRVLAELDKAGYREHTLVMLKSDHGIPVPFAKTNVWRHSTITPWIVRWPGVIEPGSRDTEHLIAGVDLAPTVLDALGIEPMEGVDGRSFLPVLQGKKQADRDVVFTHINTIASGKSYPMRSIQGPRYGFIWNGWSDGKTTFRNESMSGLTWKTMVKASATDPALAERVRHYSFREPFEFYDYQQDPDALHNLIDDPAQQAMIDQYRQEMVRQMTETNDPQLPNLQAAMGK
ncbi:sulfatase family protein [Lignipirellula cremea]|uniref:Arylsulfatase n=1 Tax=Lignipirellula cremea TaxID=2528010 RepID=A0A518E3N9_9BACT|nr:sulfatase [Lignipirellula cremea]QDU98704.1 Arylsulfatase [Lignipirellula cremea]